MIAWVLVIYLGTNAATSVSGIESEQECQALASKIVPRPSSAADPKCFSYRAAYRF